MIRLIQRRLIIPRGDTGSFSIPMIAKKIETGDEIAAVFSIFNPIQRTKVLDKLADQSNDVLTILFTHNDTVNLPVGKYVWDIKFYKNPIIEDGVFIDGEEIDSYYAAYTLPVCEIRETGDVLLTAEDAPSATLTPEALNVLSTAVSKVTTGQAIVESAAETVADKAASAAESASAASEAANSATTSANNAAASVAEMESLVRAIPTNVSEFENDAGYITAAALPTKVSDLTDDSGHYIKPAGGIPASDLAETYLTEHQDISGKANVADLAAVATSGSYEDLSDKPTIPDIQINGSSIVNNGIADIPIATVINLGLVKSSGGEGISIGADGTLKIATPSSNDYKSLSNKKAVILNAAHRAVFYGLAKAAGDTTQSQSDNAVGTYTDNAKTAIQTMLDVPSNAAMTTAIGNAISQVNSFDMAVVQALPTEDISTHTIYLVPKTGETNDVYDEYVYINSNWEMVGNTQIDLSDYALKSELPTRVSELSNDSGYLTSYTETDPTVPQWAKASTKPSYTAVEVGALSSDTHIPSTTAELTNDAGFITISEVPEVPVQDVQVNGVSVLNARGVANVPIAGGITPGAVCVDDSHGIKFWSKTDPRIILQAASSEQIKDGGWRYQPIVPITQHISAFYALAKAAGADMKDIANTTVGTYPDAQKEAIQSMLGIAQMLAPTNSNLVASQPYVIGDVFAANGHLYKATAAIAQDGAIIPDTNCVETTMAEAGGKVKDVQVNGTSVVGSDGVAEIPIGGNHIFGVVKTNPNRGTAISSSFDNDLCIAAATVGQIQLGNDIFRPIVPARQHIATFYGLSKAAGVDIGDTNDTLSEYPEASKTAIKQMLGVQDGLKVVRLI